MDNVIQFPSKPLQKKLEDSMESMRDSLSEMYEALEKIESSNLKKGSTKFVDYEKSVPNIILNQSPKEGTKISQNSKINLVISKWCIFATQNFFYW